MTTETQAAPATVEENKVFQIADRQYSVSDLSQESLMHLQNVQAATQKKNEAVVTAQLLEIAANTMQAQLVESLKDTKYVVIAKEEEATEG